MQEKVIKVLLVEDDEIDVMSIKRAFLKKKLLNEITVAGDGIEALEILRGENGKEKITPPYIILLDLNMPRMGGLEFLETIRKDNALKGSIVFILTTSSSEKDMADSYNLNAAGYILKSNIGDEFRQCVDMLHYYWQIVEIPPK